MITLSQFLHRSRLLYHMVASRLNSYQTFIFLPLNEIKCQFQTLINLCTSPHSQPTTTGCLMKIWKDRIEGSHPHTPPYSPTVQTSTSVHNTPSFGPIKPWRTINLVCNLSVPPPNRPVGGASRSSKSAFLVGPTYVINAFSRKYGS